MEENRVKDIVSMLRDVKGKKLLEETLLKYSKAIIFELEKNPNMLPEILETLDINQEEFIERLQNSNGNITFYDEALTLMKNKNIDISSGKIR